MLYKVELKFHRPPSLELKIRTDSPQSAKTIARIEARRSGFKEAKKITVTELKEEV